jgi:hypothetical protein
MLLQVLGALESLAAEATLMWFERDVDPNVGGDVVALDRAGVASLPATHEVQVVGALPSNMSLTEMLLEIIMMSFVCQSQYNYWTYEEAFGRISSLAALLPLAQ